MQLMINSVCYCFSAATYDYFHNQFALLTSGNNSEQFQTTKVFSSNVFLSKTPKCSISENVKRQDEIFLHLWSSKKKVLDLLLTGWLKCINQVGKQLPIKFLSVSWWNIEAWRAGCHSEVRDGEKMLVKNNPVKNSEYILHVTRRF